MGICSCFRQKKVVKKKIENEKNFKPSQVSNVSTGTELSTFESSEPKPKTSVSNDKDKAPTSSANISNAKSKDLVFSFRQLATATNNFQQESLIGEGGFGGVYKGKLETTDQVVAVKKLNQSGLQGDKEFLVEILMLSLLRHPNLVNLIGYCAEGDQRLVVYEFMPLGSLEDHLFDYTPDMEPLDWNTRMKIAAGAARGLDYLHNDANPPVIYRDVKSSNILLDEGFHPKLSDFGIAKFGPTDDKTHVSTRVMGTLGYCAPEYGLSGKLTMKSDIYSFGVLLLEIITGQRALDHTRGSRQRWLLDWARPMLKDRRSYVKLADPRLKGQFSGSLLCKYIDVALTCLCGNAKFRPNMRDVVSALDFLASKPYVPNTSHENNNVEGERGKMIMMNKDSERERAVAEAKMWGEACREKRRQSEGI